jgi:hypothetical protein
MGTSNNLYLGLTGGSSRCPDVAGTVSDSSPDPLPLLGSLHNQSFHPKYEPQWFLKLFLNAAHLKVLTDSRHKAADIKKRLVCGALSPCLSEFAALPRCFWDVSILLKQSV